MTSADMPRLLRVREVARELAITDRQVWRLIERGDLAVIRLGHATRIEATELDAYIERLKAGAA